jgi:M6 family metalloprotease-like protein
MDTLRKIILFAFVLLVAVATSAQERKPCVLNIPTDKAKTRGVLSCPVQDWDPQKVYRQAVVLITFADCDFSMEDPAAYYQRLFNENGYNEGYGLGSVADYFRDQSGGLFNLQFDIYGPIKVGISAKGSYNNYGFNAMEEALAALDTLTTQDFSVYDWNGDGVVEQMLFVAAGLCGNQASGYIWPNTDYTSLNAPGKKEMVNTCITCELWRDKTLCGIGTICHEFAHCLGLPDIYPTSSSSYFSVVDEWDLMDGGNYTNKGWCPPNLSTLEKMLLGWGEPTELTAATSITGMKPVSEGGETYIIRNSGHNDEFYILENRRRTNWDKGLPGEGLAIFHVDYDRDLWSSNDVNTSDSHLRYDLFHADGKDYKTWDPANNGRNPNKYVDPENWMYNKYLSTSVYPYTDPETQLINDVLNDESSPASTLFNKNAEGKLFMSKAITNVRIAADGTISFDFMGGTSGIDAIKVMDDSPAVWYDLQGRRLEGKPTRKGIYINNRKKVAL